MGTPIPQCPPSLLDGRMQNGKHGGGDKIKKDGFKNCLEDPRKKQRWTSRRKKTKKSGLTRTGTLGFAIAEGALPSSWLGNAVSGFQEHLLTETKGCATIALTRSEAKSCLSSGSRPQGQAISQGRESKGDNTRASIIMQVRSRWKELRTK